MTEKQKAAARKAIREYAVTTGWITDADARLVGQAHAALWFGDEAGHNDDGDEGVDYPGWDVACDRFRAIRDSVRELWYDNDTGAVLDSYPEPWFEALDPQPEPDDSGDTTWRIYELRGGVYGIWVEPFTDELYHYDRTDVLRAVLTRDIVGHM
jgi:hypothetical protein